MKIVPKIVRGAILVAALGALAAVLAQEKAPSAPTPPAAKTQPGSPPAGAPSQPAPAPTADANKPPASKPAPIMKDDEFIPTQEIQADEDVTFPIDI